MISLMRYLFGSILFLPLKQGIGMGEVLKYTDSGTSSFFKCWWKYEKKTHWAKLLQELESLVALLNQQS